MKKILGMPFWWSIESDEDYIEMVRHSIAFGNKIALFSGIISLLAFTAAGVFVYCLLNAFDPGRTATLTELTPGMSLGILIGSIAGFLCFVGVVELCLAANSIKGHRTEKLLLKYYDEAKTKRTDI
jgi:hypothetical protein